ncbi:hypothetical protein MIM_c32300 [Advenella mimigardefordensis DPN7]|uniref:BrnA antitoxin of type II toxin-antitoxin system n=2 Tax=Advenella mimigardefordensis TaxID=302406 RepID=W0PEF4_ADVMD|nr:hypothetical protein MIM_c32300 [Advenella mimigardefordensis DPN7]
MVKHKLKTIVPMQEEDEAIERGIDQDPDTFDPRDGFEHLKPVKLNLRGRPVGSGQKTQLTVRLDNDIISSFKATGSGWQTRLNDALKDWLKHHRPSELS